MSLTGTAWIDVDLEALKETDRVPVVTIFGAGVAGLTVAHELVERGFAVEVIEKVADPDEEYTCQVGGLAANQTARIPADVDRLHPYLFNDAGDGEDAIAVDAARGIRVWVPQAAPQSEALELFVEQEPATALAVTAGDAAVAIAAKIKAWADGTANGGVPIVVDYTPGSSELTIRSTREGHVPRITIWVAPASPGAPPTQSTSVFYERPRTLGSLRASTLEPVQQRHSISTRFVFKRSTTVDWLHFEDHEGVSNDAKLDLVLGEIGAAYEDYRAQLDARLGRPDLVALGVPERLSPRMKRREQLLVELRGHTDGDGTEAADRALSGSWAGLVRQELISRNSAAASPIPELAERLVIVPVGHREPLGNPRRDFWRRRMNRVEVRIVEHVIPGEHGYRYFPRFYRHLFDTMKRTPILDENGQESGRTAFDQLVPTPTVDLALADDEAPIEVPIHGPRSIEKLRQLLEIHLSPAKLGLSERDLLRFQAKLLRFATSSTARRKTYEEQSWWDFVDGAGYSERMSSILRDTPQALVAMNAEETDARTQGTVFLQLLLDAYAYDCCEGMNYTLNGPTSTAWLCHWKRYLARQGVRFRRGELVQLGWTSGGALVPVYATCMGGGSMAYLIIGTDPRDGLRTPGRAPLGPLGVLGGFEIALDATDPFPGPTASLADLTAWVARRLEAVREVAVEVLRIDPSRGRLGLRAVLPRGSRVLRVRQVSGAVPRHRIQINGSDVEIAAASDLASLRAHLHDALIDFVRAELSPSSRNRTIFFAAFGERSLSIRIGRRAAIVSLVSAVAGEYGVVVEGLRIVVQVSGRSSEPSIRDVLLRAIRDRVAAAEPAVPVQVERFGETGIAFVREDDTTIFVDVSSWDGRVAYGPDVRIPAEEGDFFQAVPGDRVDVRSTWSGFLVQGADLDLDEGFSYPALELGPPALQATSGGGSDFYVLAIPYETASDLIWSAHLDPNKPAGVDIDGCFRELMDFDIATGRRLADGSVVDPQRDGSGRPFPPTWPLRDLSGIQYYFANEVRIGRGHTYFRDAAWGLSSISQVAYWKTRLAHQSAFLGQLSVDVGNWYTASTFTDAMGVAHALPSPWRSPRQQIAVEVWRQIKAGLEQPFAAAVEAPAYYHLDQGIRFQDAGARCFAGGAWIAGSGNPNGELTVDGTTIAVPGNADADALVAAIEAAVENVVAKVEANEVVLAPSVVDTPVVDVVVRSAQPSLPYRISIGGTRGVVSGAGTTAQTRDALVQAINDDVPGVIAAAVDGGLPGEARLRLTLANPGQRVSALAVERVAGPPAALVVRMALDPAGGVDVVPGAETSLRDVDSATPIDDATAFLINNPGRGTVDRSPAGPPQLVSGPIWRWRSGLAAAPDEPDPAAEEADIWYEPTLARWLMAGNQMATWTRLSTMESANESARHAVRAMLHAVLTTPLPASPPATYNGQGRLLGDFPEIFRPEEHEFDDASPLKRLDEKLMATASGALPHFMDILEIDKWIDGLPEDLVGAQLPDQLPQLLRDAIQQFEEDWSFSDADEVSKAVRNAAKALLGIP